MGRLAPVLLLSALLFADDPPAKGAVPSELLTEASGEKAVAALADAIPCPRCGRSKRLSRHCGRCGGDGRFACSPCGGKGKVACSNPACKKGKLHYENAKLNPDTCKVCAGSGLIRCAPCGGAGAIKCAECKGSGAVPWSCDLGAGKKSIPLPTEGAPCVSCQGSSEVNCALCGGSGKDSVACPTCGGVGWRACSGCGGASRLACPAEYCNGKGFTRAVWADDRTSAQKNGCNVCEGSGVQACAKCKRGTEDCADCSRSGRKELSCVSCWGRGKRACPVCVAGTLWGAKTDGGGLLFACRLADVAPVLEGNLRVALQAHATGDAASWIFCDWILLIADNRQAAVPIPWTESTDILALGGATVEPVVRREKLLELDGLKAAFEADLTACGCAPGLLQGGSTAPKACRVFLVMVHSMSASARSAVEGAGAPHPPIPPAGVAADEALRIAYGGAPQGSETLVATLPSGTMDARTRALLLDTYWKEVFMRK